MAKGKEKQGQGQGKQAASSAAAKAAASAAASGEKQSSAAGLNPLHLGWPILVGVGALCAAQAGIFRAKEPEKEAEKPQPSLKARKTPRLLTEMYACTLPCSKLTQGDMAKVDEQLDGLCQQTADAGICAMSPQQFCAAQCGSGQTDMSQWLPESFGRGGAALPSSKAEEEADVRALNEAFNAHLQCSSTCRDAGVAVDVAKASSAPAAAKRAAEVLQRCGVVHLVGVIEAATMQSIEDGIEALRKQSKRVDKLTDTKQLHDKRWQVYLPFEAPFNRKEGVGVNDVVFAVLKDYMQGVEFGMDHVSVLTSSSPCGNQSLHPDNPSYQRLTVQVHTAIMDITPEMGPTGFCPCTGEVDDEALWPVSAAIKMVMLKKRACLASMYRPSFVSKGTVTIYDGATFHGGLENLSGRNRDVLKLELGAGDFPERRDYTNKAPKTAKKEVQKFRQAFGPPNFGQAVR
eukprot:TRINITY_DN29815_c0_g1_i2.p1 TRINITY_DN29815_c0_g1~~TRINITY_DN29815_c0_g1_i2.p1  ORF type:complete len:460 (+),score=140.95 TRINITY_DN29815_c0_g1_i2:151-1530(+)